MGSIFDLLILRVKLFITYLRCRTTIDIKTEPGKKNIFLFLGADYGNLGDVAITYAQLRFLRERYSDYNVIEIPIGRTLSGIRSVRKVAKPDDIICLIGGGNTSDKYDDIEFFRQLVIWNFRKHRIIAFPQTFDFSDTFRGRFCKVVAHFVYRRAKRLTFMAREANTMAVLQKDFADIDTVLMPDVVMTLDLRADKPRKGALVCMRSDKEQSVSPAKRQELIGRLQAKYGQVDVRDTETPGVNETNRFEKLQELIEQFQTHEIVVTDRLHGMILSFVTGTPALALDNSNHKVSACYEWIKDCGYIKMMQTLDDINTFQPRGNFDETHKVIMDKYNKLECLKFQ